MHGTWIKALAKAVLPTAFYCWLRRQQQRIQGPLSRRVRFGNLRRLTPVSQVFGFDRGQPIDRYYIESFLQDHSTDICGGVLEIGDSTYTRKFGGNRVTRSEVLHVEPGNSSVTLVGDLATGHGIPCGMYDCLVLTQTLQFIYDIKSAIIHAHDALKPGGVLLVTTSGISQISRYDMDRWGDYWRFTDASLRRLFADVFGEESVSVDLYGNVLVACAFLHGLASEELTPTELDYLDPDYPVVITVRAVKRQRGN